MTGGATDDQLFRSVFESTLDALLLADDEGVYIDVNDPACDLFGCDAEELIGTSIADYLSASTRLESTWGSFLEDEKAAGTFELHRPDGDIRTIEFSANADIQPGIHLLTLRDITERQEYRRMLEQQNRRLEEYSATVSHDLRTPLSVASGWLSVAIDEDSTEPLGKVDEALTRISELITDLRALGRHGQTVTEMNEVDLEALASDVWSDLDTVTAPLEIEEEIGQIHGDEERILQLFENLFRNSVEHGSTGSRSQTGDSVEHGSTSSRPQSDDAIEHAGPNVTVRVGPLTNGFYVEDDGPGIPADTRESVFEFGYSTTEHGAGVGLAIVEAIADAHGWQSDLIDGDSGGTRFEFRTGWHPDYDRE